MATQKKIPMRQCMGCREMKPKRELIRVVRGPEGGVSLDMKGKAPGRGAYLCPDTACLKRARKTGAIGFSGSVLFDTGRNELKDSGKQLLNRFIPIYLRTLMSSEYQEYIGEIIIEGHTDTSGSYLSNLKLSQERALTVATYCLGGEMTGISPAEKQLLQDIMTVNGRSYSDPVYNADHTVNMEASRRVVFKFRMKDAEMIDQMSTILEGQGY